MVKKLASMLAAVVLTLASAGVARADGGYLGIYLEDETVATKGAYVEEVAPESPADKAGIRKGDLVVAFNGEKTPNSHALIQRLVKVSPGEQLTLRLSRDEWEREVKVTLGKREGTPAKKTEAPAESTGSERGFLGCFFKQNPDGPGALVDEVVQGSPAAKANLKKGDIVNGVDGHATKDYTQLQEFLRGTKPGQKIKLRVSREGWEREVSVELGRRPASAEKPTAEKPVEKPAPKTEKPAAKVESPKKPAFLGVSLVDNDGKGPLKVDDVMPNGPAEKGGIKPGDTIVAIGEKKVKTIKDFEDCLKQHHAGEAVVVRIDRDGWAREVKVTFGERQD